MRRREIQWIEDNLTFKEIERSDIEKVKQLHVQLFPVKYGAKFYNALLQKDVFSTLIALNTEKEVVGVITVRIDYSESIFDKYCNCLRKREAYISTIGVATEYRNKGLATFLLDYMLDRIKDIGCHSISLHVKIDNHAAIQFYLRNDFAKLELMTDYYCIDGINYDAWRMGKVLGTTTKENSGISNWIIRKYHDVYQYCTGAYQSSQRETNV